MLFLRQQLQTCASRNMQRGLSHSAETLAIEGELAQVQARAADLHRERQELIRHIQYLTQKRHHLAAEMRLPMDGTATAAEDDEEVALTLGDIGEADDRVKKYFGILPKDQQRTTTAAAAAAAAEVKTVRMVKRDSKERSVSRAAAGEDEGQGGAAEEEMHKRRAVSDEPKRRGQEALPQQPLRGGSLPRGIGLGGISNNGGGHCSGGELSSGSAGDSGIFGSRTMLNNSNNNGRSPAAFFKLGDCRKRASFGSDQNYHHHQQQPRPSSALSARERLFGSSRESSMSPPTSPGGNGGATSASSLVASPIFKSDTARQIAEEVGRVSGGPRLRRARKQRSHTISGGNPAVAEALQAEQAKLVSYSSHYILLSMHKEMM